jgi:hypothetical protein
MVVPTIICSGLITAIGFLYTSSDEVVLVCTPPTAVRGGALNIWLLTNLIINILVIFTYGKVFFWLRKQGNMLNVNYESFRTEMHGKK